jgi:hypothetical protein
MIFENEIQAREYLQSTDFYFTVDKFAQLTSEHKTELEASREAARQYIRTLLDETVKEQ